MSTFSQLTQDQKRLALEIRFIHDIDYSPSPEEHYLALPEPYRTRSLNALAERRENWKQSIADKLKKYA